MITILPGLISMACWGIAIYLAATVSRKIGNVLTLFWMQVFGQSLGVIYFIRNIGSFNDNFTSFVPVLLLIALCQIVAYLSFYRGMEKGQVSIVSPLGSTWSLITAVLGITIYHEIVSAKQILSIVCIVIGILSISFNLREILQTKKLELLGGVKEGILSMLGWGFAWFLTVMPTRELGWFLPTFIFRTFLIILIGAYLLYQKKKVITKHKFPWPELIVIGIFDMLAFFSLSIGIARTNSSIIAPIASANSIIVIMLAMFFLKEKLKWNQVAGIVLILFGIVTIT
ncbi:DMT family transporter [Patescibacteria group bacterium]